jgi:hypothetical protein
MTILFVYLLENRILLVRMQIKEENGQFWFESCDSNIFTNRRKVEQCGHGKNPT